MAAATIHSRMSIGDWAMLLLLSVLWGGSYFFIEIAIREWPPLLVVAVRVPIAALFIWVLVLAMRLPVPRLPGVWFAFLVMGLLNNIIPFLLITWGLQSVASGLAAILNAAAPIFTVFVAGFLLKDEPTTRAKVLGAVLGLAGVVILIGPSAVNGVDSSLLAQGALLAAALSYAFAGIWGRRFKAMQVDPVVAAAGQLLCSSVLLVPMALWFEPVSLLPSTGASVWLAVLALAVLSTALAYVLYFRLLASAGATNLMLVTLLIPVTAILLGFFVLGERLLPWHFAGMAVVALGLSVIDGRLWSRKSNAPG